MQVVMVMDHPGQSQGHSSQAKPSDQERLTLIPSLDYLYQENAQQLGVMVDSRLPIRTIQSSPCWFQLTVLHRHYEAHFPDPAVLLYRAFRADAGVSALAVS